MCVLVLRMRDSDMSWSFASCACVNELQVLPYFLHSQLHPHSPLSLIQTSLVNQTMSHFAKLSFRLSLTQPVVLPQKHGGIRTLC